MSRNFIKGCIESAYSAFANKSLFSDRCEVIISFEPRSMGSKAEQKKYLFTLNESGVIEFLTDLTFLLFNKLKN